jgi:hypothetical protein
MRYHVGMGLEIVVPRPSPCPLAPLLERLTASGFPTSIAMVDNQLWSPRATPPGQWRDVRLRTPAGIVTLLHRPEGVAVVIFGNADAVLQEAQRRVAEALLGSA